MLMPHEIEVWYELHMCFENPQSNNYNVVLHVESAENYEPELMAMIEKKTSVGHTLLWWKVIRESVETLASFTA